MNDWLYHRVRASPGRPALVRAETGEEWDYAELDAAVRETAGRLAALGVTAGDHLGVVVRTRVTSVRLVHAAARLGATLVPLSPRLTARELRGQVERADLAALVCGEATEGTAVEAAGDVPVATVDAPANEEVTALREVDPAAFDRADWDRDDAQLILFTSGTTGKPKAVRLTQRNLLSSAVASAFRLGVRPDDRWLVALALHHMGGIGPVLRGPLYGMAVVLREEFDAGPVADDIAAHDVTAVSLVPTMLRRTLDSRGTLADSLRVVLLGGAPAPDELVERCRDRSVPAYPTYGMTETASQVATATPAEAFAHVGTVGRPLMWTDVTVRDADGKPFPAGKMGELVVSGPTVSPGYYDDPEATAEAFTSEGLLTGDVGYRDEAGRLYVVGRVDDRIITGGENVYPGEVETALRAHPGVVDAAVVGLPDEEWGELVAALVVPAGDDVPDVESLREFCRDRLAGFKLPRAVAVTDELPRTDSGTVDRGAVVDSLAGRRIGVSDPPDAED